MTKAFSGVPWVSPEESQVSFSVKPQPLSSPCFLTQCTLIILWLGAIHPELLTSSLNKWVRRKTCCERLGVRTVATNLLGPVHPQGDPTVFSSVSTKFHVISNSINCADGKWFKKERRRAEEWKGGKEKREWKEMEKGRIKMEEKENEMIKEQKL